MKTFTTVENSVHLAVGVLVEKRIPFSVKRIRDCVYSWYSHTDVTDIEVLAACALEGKDWSPSATYDNMLAARDKWFPLVSDANLIPIWEIEAAQHDAMWR